MSSNKSNANVSHGINRKYNGNNADTKTAITSMLLYAEGLEAPMPYTKAKSLLKTLANIGATKGWKTNSPAILLEAATKKMGGKASKGKATPKATKKDSANKAQAAANAPITGESALAEQVAKLAQQVETLTAMMVANKG